MATHFNKRAAKEAVKVPWIKSEILTNTNWLPLTMKASEKETSVSTPEACAVQPGLAGETNVVDF